MQEVVVGIDFGTSGTGYAYSFNDSKNIELGKFKGQNTGIKVPSEIILDNNLQNVLSFGEKCSILDNNLQNVLSFGEKCSTYKLKEGDLYFKGIKMNIYHNNNYITPENDSKSFPLIDIITKIIEYIKHIALDSIHENKAFISEDQIKWIVTVPSIWDLAQKDM